MTTGAEGLGGDGHQRAGIALSGYTAPCTAGWCMSCGRRGLFRRACTRARRLAAERRRQGVCPTPSWQCTPLNTPLSVMFYAYDMGPIPVSCPSTTLEFLDPDAYRHNYVIWLHNLVDASLNYSETYC